MPAGVLKIEDDLFEVEIQTAGDPLYYTGPVLFAWVAAIREWFEAVEIEKFELLPNTEPDVYNYRFKHVDGRTWKQEIDFSDPALTLDPPMSINTGQDRWKKSEFILHRDVRDLTIQLHNDWRVENIKVDRTP